MPLYNGLYVSDDERTSTVDLVPNLAKPPTDAVREGWRRYLSVARTVPTSSRRHPGDRWLFWSGALIGFGAGLMGAAMGAGWLL